MRAVASGEASAMGASLEAREVRALFDRIAGRYDRLNGVMTAGLHHAWCGRAADLAGSAGGWGAGCGGGHW
jgi:demethylmenaquinone methyltransferase / 2-methoxy-6-polyprenyl-1,4-benzoquinol methylase